jgi:hypothetical protein
MKVKRKKQIDARRLLWRVVHWRRHEHRLSIVIIGLLVSRLEPSIALVITTPFLMAMPTATVTPPFLVVMPFAPVTSPMAFATLSER